MPLQRSMRSRARAGLFLDPWRPSPVSVLQAAHDRRLPRPVDDNPTGPKGQGRFDPFATPSGNNRYLREADLRDDALFVRLGIGPKTFAPKIFLFSEIVLSLRFSREARR